MKQPNVIQEESISAGVLGQTEEWYGGQLSCSAEGPNVQGQTDTFRNVQQSLLRSHSSLSQISISCLEILEDPSRWPSLFLGT